MRFSFQGQELNENENNFKFLLRIFMCCKFYFIAKIGISDMSCRNETQFKMTFTQLIWETVYNGKIF